MAARPAPQWAVRGAWVLACAWPVAVHAAILLGGAEWAPRVTAVAAVLAACLWAGAVRTTAAGTTVLLTATIAAALAFVAPQLLLYAPSVAIPLALAAAFGASLRTGHTPVISRFARMEQGDLPPDLARHARVLTWIWAALLFAMAWVAAGLAFLAPLELWSAFANVVSYLLVAALVIGEYGYRRWRFRHYRHATLLDLVHNIRRAGLLHGRRLER